MPRTLRAQMSAEESVPEVGKWTGRTGLGRSSSLRAVFKPDSVPLSHPLDSPCPIIPLTFGRTDRIAPFDPSSS